MVGYDLPKNSINNALGKRFEAFVRKESKDFG